MYKILNNEEVGPVVLTRCSSGHWVYSQWRERRHAVHRAQSKIIITIFHASQNQLDARRAPHCTPLLCTALYCTVRSQLRLVESRRFPHGAPVAPRRAAVFVAPRVRAYSMCAARRCAATGASSVWKRCPNIHSKSIQLGVEWWNE